MNAPFEDDRSQSRPGQEDSGTRLGSLERYALWIIYSAVATGGVVLLAWELQRVGVAPAVLLPVGVGIALAAAVEWSAPGRRRSQPRMALGGRRVGPVGDRWAGLLGLSPVLQVVRRRLAGQSRGGDGAAATSAWARRH